MEHYVSETSTGTDDRESLYGGPEIPENRNTRGFLLKDDTRGNRIKRSITARTRRRALKLIREERELNRFGRLRSERKKLKKMKKRGLHLR